MTTTTPATTPCRRLRELRRAAALTQRELAHLARVSRGTIAHLEQGRYPPTPKAAAKISRVLQDKLGPTFVAGPWAVFPEHMPEPQAAATAVVSGHVLVEIMPKSGAIQLVSDTTLNRRTLAAWHRVDLDLFDKLAGDRLFRTNSRWLIGRCKIEPNVKG